MSQRKPHNRRARLERACRALLSTNHVAVVNIDPVGRQFLINWKSAKKIVSRQVVDAVCDMSHHWSICIGAFCTDQFGDSYIKFSKVAPAGIYLAKHLDDFIEEHYRALLASCNPMHLVGSGWIATPYDVELSDEQARMVFDAVNAWPALEVA